MKRTERQRFSEGGGGHQHPPKHTLNSECVCTHEEKKTFVFANGSAAAQEAQQKQHASHSQDDVDAGEQQGVGRYDFPESCGVHQHPDAHSQQEGAPQLMEMQHKTAVRRSRNRLHIKGEIRGGLQLVHITPIRRCMMGINVPSGTAWTVGELKAEEGTDIPGATPVHGAAEEWSLLPLFD